MELIRVGISACLVGQEVRYNGAHKRNDRLIDVLGARFQLVPVCPEVEMGLGTPREPMNLYRDTSLRMITVNTRIDHTEAMRAFAARRLDELGDEDLCGFVLKKDSPSCGLSGTPTYDLAGGGQQRDGRGLFAAAVTDRFPQMPVADEASLAEPQALDRFVERVVAYSRKSPRRAVTVLRFTPSGAVEQQDEAAAEEPLEIRLHDRPFAVVMRTPGADRELAAGFLLSEGVISSADDLGALEHCRHPDHPHVHNVVNAFLLGDASHALSERLAERRNVVANASCGVCGRTSIDSLKVRVASIEARSIIAPEVMRSLPDRLRARQPIFDRTGALHAAGVFTMAGECLTIAEDVGRHNAVDKVIGTMMLDGHLPLTGHALVVSGRSSYEIVQKAWVAGLEIICAVSAPSSLAIELAQEAGVTLAGFARGDAFNVYSHASRVRV